MLATGITCLIINEAKIISAHITLFSEVDSFKNYRLEIFCSALCVALSLCFLLKNCHLQ